MGLAPPGRRGSLGAGEPGTSRLICPDCSPAASIYPVSQPSPPWGDVQAGGAGGVLRWVARVYNTVFEGQP